MEVGGIMTLGQKLRSARIAKGWTQPQLANEVKVPIESISRWESDQRVPRIDRLTTVAKVLDVPVAFLLDEKAGYSTSAIVAELREIKKLLKLLAEREAKE